MRTVFFGTPEIAVPALEALAETTELVAVVSQPDRPAGRKLLSRPGAVKVAAERLGVPVHQPLRVKQDLDSWLRERRADLAVVLAYGRILPKTVLDAPRLGCVNLHASLLPEFRGAAPIARALEAGRTVTGVSLMQMDEGLDTGPVYVERSLQIHDEWDAGDLTRELGALCAVMIREDLSRVLAGALPIPQSADGVSYAPPIRAEEARVNWSEPAARLHAKVRAFAPAPGAFTFCRGKRVKVLRTLVSDAGGAGEPALGVAGTVVECTRARLVVATGQGNLQILRAQLEGKNALPAAELVNGRAFSLGDVLG